MHYPVHTYISELITTITTLLMKESNTFYFNENFDVTVLASRVYSYNINRNN